MARALDFLKVNLGSVHHTAQQALSDLFLDIELSDENILDIARSLRSTGLGIAELERIYQEEVAPACWRNIGAIPRGVCRAFEPEWLRYMISWRQGRQRKWQWCPWVKRLFIRRWTRLSDPDWERVKRSLAESDPDVPMADAIGIDPVHGWSDSDDLCDHAIRDRRRGWPHFPQLHSESHPPPHGDALLAGRGTQADGAIERVDPTSLTVWQALADLFLYYELSDEDILDIARNLRSTGLGIAELERIYQEKVAPACCRNFVAIPRCAYTAFEPEWLIHMISWQRRRRWKWQWSPWVKRFFVGRWTRLSDPDWEHVKRSLAESDPDAPLAYANGIDPARIVAWEALSDLFLDTKFDDLEVAFVVRRLRSTGFSVAELERIYQEEVAPACWRNTRAIAGVWGGFQRRWLVGAIQRRQRDQGPWQRIPWVKRRLVNYWTKLTNPDWERVKQALTEA